ncbi:MAG: hypothetical protein ACJAT4_001585 [Granulosicoccus sp.]|jgi:hypothetical protein
MISNRLEYFTIEYIYGKIMPRIDLDPEVDLLI